jgi:pimeloyl-ACP methyl ester carboxylesterase
MPIHRRGVGEVTVGRSPDRLVCLSATKEPDDARRNALKRHDRRALLRRPVRAALGAGEGNDYSSDHPRRQGGWARLQRGDGLQKTEVMISVRPEGTIDWGPLTRVGRVAAVCACLVCTDCGLTQRVQDAFFDSNGVAIRYRVSGQGPSVVLIHGFGETLERWQSAGIIPLLSPHFQVIAMDVRGHGRSGKPHNEGSYGAELTSDILRLLRHLRVTKAHIVGYSMGAMIALDFAVLHQQHTLSIVLGGAGWNPPEILDEFRQQAEAFERGEVPARDGDDPKALAALLRGVRVLSETDVRSINVPMAAFIGSQDRFMPNVHRLSRVLPRVNVQIIPGANHTTAITHPRFGTALLAFLRGE